MRRRTVLLSTAAILMLAFAGGALAQATPKWTEPRAPFRIAGNLYYVGSRDLASYLITTPQGNILINSSLEENVPMIKASIEKLGFKFSDTKILLISHAHWDHDAGSATIKEATGATYMVMDADVRDVESDGKTYNVVIVGSTTVNRRFKLIDNTDYPQIVADYERMWVVLKSLPCDIFLGAHGEYFGLDEKYPRLKEGSPNPFIDPDGYKKYVAEKEKAFYVELARQKADAAR